MVLRRNFRRFGGDAHSKQRRRQEDGRVGRTYERRFFADEDPFEDEFQKRLIGRRGEGGGVPVEEIDAGVLNSCLAAFAAITDS